MHGDRKTIQAARLVREVLLTFDRLKSGDEPSRGVVSALTAALDTAILAIPTRRVTDAARDTANLGGP